MSRTVLTDPYFANAIAKERAYLKRFDIDRLAAGFRRTAGIATRATTYGGWETSLISGHFVGHYLTAVSQAYGIGNDEEFLPIAKRLVAALAEAQQADGFLFATAGDVPGRKQFDNVEAGKSDIRTEAWVPWYTMHKLLAGLVAAYEFCGLEESLACASKLGDWVYARTSTWSEETRTRVLALEYGGMNDCLYELYKLTRKGEYAIAAHAFDELPLFEAVHAGKDVLDGRHANTTIPKFIGALNRYRAWRDVGAEAFERAGDAGDVGFYLEAAERFWEMVVRDHSYVTGGNSDDEHFGPARVLNAERSNVNCETCNTYNMLKLSKGLFEARGDKKYMDFYENVFINAILSSQNPETGMTMYFQPMATGYFKVFSSAFDHFWCCTGTGTESFTKLEEGPFSCEGDILRVNLYINSTFDWAEKGLRIAQSSEIPEGESVAFTIEGRARFEMRLRIPDWCAEAVAITLNGRSIEPPILGGYATVARAWESGDRLEMRLPMRAVAHSLPDDPETCAFKYGPVVLSASLGENDMATASHGVDVLKSASKGDADERVFIDKGYGSKARWLRHLGKNLERRGGGFEFTLLNTNRDLIFSPHYRRYRQRYGIYWKILDAEGEGKGAIQHGDTA